MTMFAVDLMLHGVQYDATLAVLLMFGLLWHMLGSASVRW